MAGAASQAGDADSSRAPGLTSGLQGPWMSTVVLYCWCHSDSASVLLYFTFLSHLVPLPCGAGSTVPREGSTQVLLCLFPGVLWLWHFLYSVGPHPVSSLHIYTLVVSRAFMAGAASQAGDADSSCGTCLTLVCRGPVNSPPWCSIVGATVTVHQFFCILHLYHIFITSPAFGWLLVFGLYKGKKEGI